MEMITRLHIIAVTVTLFLSFPQLHAQQWSASTNVIDYVNLGTFNAELTYGVARHWSLTAGAKYNPFSFTGASGQVARHRQQQYAIGARWWPWHVNSGWWGAAKLQYQEYNMGGVFSNSTEEGDCYGGGLTAGYTHMLNKHLNLEFGLGLWGGYKVYTVYSCPECGITEEQGTKFFFAPNDIIVSVAYVF